MNECLKLAKDRFKDSLGEQEIDRVFETLNKVYSKEMINRDMQGIRQKGFEYLQQRRKSIIQEKYVLAQNIVDYKELKHRVELAWDDMAKTYPDEGKRVVGVIESLLFNDSKHGGASIESVRKSQIGKYTSFLFDLEQKFGTSIKDKIARKEFTNKLLEAIKDGAFDDSILVELWNLGKGNPIQTNDPTIRSIVESFHKVNRMMDTDKAAINPLYKTRKDYGVTIHMDPDRVAHRGLDGFKSDMLAHVDFNRIKTKLMQNHGFDLTDDLIDPLIEDIYKSVTEQGYSLDKQVSSKALKNASDPLMMMRVISEGRFLEYKTAEGFATIFKSYSAGTAFDSTMKSIDTTTRGIALDTVLGKMPFVNLELTAEKLLQKVEDVQSRKQAKQDLDRNLQAMYQRASGTSPVVDNIYAKATKNIKAVTTSALLGSASIGAWLTDPAFAAGVFGGLSKRNVFSQYLDVLKTTFHTMKKEDRIAVGKKMDSFLTDTQMSILHQVTGEDFERKKESIPTKIADFTLNASTFKIQNLVAKITNDRLHAHAVAMDLKNDNRNSGIINRIRSYGIQEHDIELMSLLAKHEDAVYVQSIREIPYETARDILHEAGVDPIMGLQSTDKIGDFKWTDEQVKRYLNKLAYKYSAANYDLSRMASPTPNDYVFYKTQGGGASDLGSSFLSLGMQFKTFSVGLLRTYRLLNNEKLVSNRLKTITPMIGLLVGLGGLKTMMQDLLNGEVPTDPTAFDEDAPILNNFFVKAIANSGVLPLLGDIVLRDYKESGGDFVSTLAGPGAKMGKDAVESLQALLSGVGEDEFKVKSVAKPLTKWIPLNNLWYSKAITSKYFLDAIKEGIDPEWRDMEERSRQKAREANSGLLWEQQDLFE